MGRVYTLDYLRGIFALSILGYHIVSWSIGVPGSENILGRLGVYGVSMFYIISGISMAITYKSVGWDLLSIRTFFVRRFFRLAPLFCLATFLTVIHFLTIKAPIDISAIKIVSNVFLLFGFYDPGYAFVVGAWSIGNEFVFYFVFPVLMLIVWRGTNGVIALIVASLLLMLYYGFVLLPNFKNLFLAWGVYISPLNNIPYFIIGVCIPELSNLIKDKFGCDKSVFFVFMFLAFFVFYPASGNQINIVSGVNRVMFSAICFAICISAYMTKVRGRGITHKILSFFGDVSYAVYILHGVVYYYAVRFLWPHAKNQFDITMFGFLCFFVVPIVIVLSALAHTFIEKPFIRFAKYMTRRPADRYQVAE